MVRNYKHLHFTHKGTSSGRLNNLPWSQNQDLAEPSLISDLPEYRVQAVN